MNDLYQKALQRLLQHSNGDDVGLWQVINRINDVLGIKNYKIPSAKMEEFWQAMSYLVTGMLQGGLLATNPLKDGSYIVWPQQDPEQVLAHIKEKWASLNGAFPDVGFIVWFHKVKN